MLPEELIEIVKRIAPEDVNSIIIDNATAIKKYTYCYIEAYAQRIEFKSERRTAAVDDTMAQDIVEISRRSSDSPFVRLDDNAVIDAIKKAPKYSTESLFSSAAKRVEELKNGGRTVDHHHVILNTIDGRLSNKQPMFVVKEECGVRECPCCKGTGLVERTDKQGMVEQVTCSDCKGNRHIGTLSYIVPTISEKKAKMIHCLDGEISNIKDSVIESHKDDDCTPTRMLTHFNGTENENYPMELIPYLELIHDKIGDNNAIEEIYYRLVPCFTFQYRNVLTSKIKTAVLVDPYNKPELLLAPSSAGQKMASSVKDSIKSIGRFFGNISKSEAFKDKEDLRRTVRLLIAIAVADGKVSEEEKQTLTLAIRNIEQLTTSECDGMLKLLGSENNSFLNDDDFCFHNKDNARETLTRMQEIAGADGEVQDEERDIIEKLRLTL